MTYNFYIVDVCSNRDVARIRLAVWLDLIRLSRHEHGRAVLPIAGEVGECDEARIGQADRFAENELWPLQQKIDDEEWWPPQAMPETAPAATSSIAALGIAGQVLDLGHRDIGERLMGGDYARVEKLRLFDPA